jgi:hypothetical protein
MDIDKIIKRFLVIGLVGIFVITFIGLFNSLSIVKIIKFDLLFVSFNFLMFAFTGLIESI